MKKIFIPIALLLLIFAGIAWLRFAPGGQDFWTNLRTSELLAPIIVIAALLDSINPCAFSVLLLTIAFLFNLSKSRARILFVGLSYIFGIFLTYVLIGLGVLRALTFFNTPHFMAKVGAAIIIAFGVINLINEYFPRFPIKLKIPEAAHGQLATFIEKASVPTALVLGILVGLYEFPCTGGPYLLVLGLLHDASTFSSGLGYLLLYNFIFVLPLLIILVIASDRELLVKVQAWQKENKRESRLAMGLAMIVLGAIIFIL